MEKNKKENGKLNQSKEKKETLTDYLELKLREAGIKYQRKELPEDLVRVIFKQ